VWRTGDGRDAEAGSGEVDRGGGRGCGGGSEGEREEEAGHRRGGRGKDFFCLGWGEGGEDEEHGSGGSGEKGRGKDFFRFLFFRNICRKNFLNCYVSCLNH
jgi:hypothetical protein